MRKKWRYKTKPLLRRNLSTAKDRLRLQCTKKNRDLEIRLSRRMRLRLLEKVILRHPHEKPEPDPLPTGMEFTHCWTPDNAYERSAEKHRTENRTIPYSVYYNTSTATSNDPW